MTHSTGGSGKTTGSYSCDMFTDTLEASEASWHQKNKYAQVFATKFCWV